MLAVSGSHIAAIVLLIYQPLKRLNLPLFVIKGITIIVLALFAQYTNYAPSAVRAIIMTTLVLLITKQIKIKGIQLLAFAFIIMFILNPLVVYDIGFQFSFIISFYYAAFPFTAIVKVTIIIHNYVYCTISFIYRCHSKLSSTSMGGIFI